MSTYQHNCNSDFRNEDWTVTGSGISHAWEAWSAIGDDTKYCENPSSKGRACVRFPVDISGGSIPAGSAIESVTIYIRAKKTDGNSRSVTVNLLCSDNTSHHTQRTIQLTTDITTIPVGTYTKDALGRKWTKDRLDRLMIQCFSYCGSAGKIRVYECYAVINYRNRPVVTVTSPSGTVDSASPAIAWTYTQVDGDTQKSAEYKIFTAAQQELATFNPDVTPSVYPASTTYTVKAGDSLWKIAAQFYGDGALWPQIYHASNLSSGNPDLIYPGEIVTIPGVASVQGDITSLTSLPFALAANDYYIYVRATSHRHARSDWANRTFTVTGASPGVPGGGGGSLGGVGVGGGGGFESVIADSTYSNAYLTLRDGSNLMSVQQSDFETLTDTIGYWGWNAALSQDTTVNFGIGAGSLKMVATGAVSAMEAISTLIEVEESTPITARAQFRSAVTSRTAGVYVQYYDSAFTQLGGTLHNSAADSSTTWTEVVVTGTVPAGTTYAQVVLEIENPVNAEVHNVDHIGLMYGTNAAWSNGGHASRNLLSNGASSADDPITTEPWTAATASTYSRVATTGTGSDGLKAFKMLYAGVSPSIAYVATGAAFTDTSTGVGYTLNKPAGVADGDLLVAYVSSNTGGQATPPSGWTVVDFADAGALDLTVMMRDGLAADPSSWAGNLASSATRKRAVVVAYRGAASTGVQFPQENVSTSVSGSTTVTSASVSNPDPSAWRLSAFAVNDNASGGTMTANITSPAPSSAISYVGKGGTYTHTGGSSAFTIYKPTGLASGDLMIAVVSFDGIFTVNAPAGWTVVRTTSHGSITTGILKRTAGGSEPASWAGTCSGGLSYTTVSQTVAYRNAADASLQFIAESGSGGGSASPSTPTVTNTDSAAWRVCAFSAAAYTAESWTATEVSERADNGAGNGSSYFNVSVSVYDSNGPVSTGSQTREGFVSNTSQIESSSAWIGIIKPLAAGPSPGANESERADATAGAADPWITLAAYDSNGVAATGSTTVYGTFTPGSGSATVATCAWEGFLIPATPTVAGEVGAVTSGYVDITSVSPDVIDRAGNQMTVQASFLGSTAGVPHLIMYAYTGNELISTQVFEGSPFGTAAWTRSVTQFVLPQGATRLKVGVSAVDRVISDYVLFDRVSLAFGTSTVYRPGTGRAAHPIFNVPSVEYAEDLGDGYGDWKPLPGTSNSLLKYDNLTGLCTLVDQTIVPLSARKYRAKTVSYGLAGDIFVSGYGPESEEVTLEAEEWWLKDMQVPDNSMKLRVSGDGPLKVMTNDTSAVFQPLGSNRPIVITEGYKGDVITLTIQVRRLDYTRLRNLFNARRTLYLQSNLDNAWWVRPNGDIQSQTMPTSTRTTDPLRFIDVSFVEVDPEV